MCLSGACQLPTDCVTLLRLDPARPSGVYLLDPDGAGPVAPLAGSCDMDPANDGGGWLLVLQYTRPAGSDPEVQLRPDSLPLLGLDELGTDEHGTDRWGHASAALLAAFAPSQLRFAGRTSDHERVMNFFTELPSALRYVTTGLGSFAGVAFDFTALPGHTTRLPGNANGYFTDQGDAALLNHPFYRGGLDHWNVGAAERWEVDGWLVNEFNGGEVGQGYTAATSQRVWIRRDLCHDELLDRDETDVDCGGAHCAPCLAGADCVADDDCASLVCADGACAEPTCGDGLINSPDEA